MEEAVLQAGLIGRVYDAALDERLWAGVTGEVSRAFGSTSTALLLQPAGAGAYFLDRTSNFEDSVVAPYEAYYWEKDVWALAAQRMGLSKVYMSADMITDAEFQRTEYYTDWCRQANVFYCIGSVFHVTPTELGLIGIHRVKSLANYEEGDRARVAAFLPHLERALKLRSRLVRAGLSERFTFETLERLKAAVFVVDAKARVVFANPFAQSVVQPGSPLRMQAGTLYAQGATASRAFSGLVADAVATANGQARPAGASLALERGMRFPLTVTVVPLRAAPGCDEPLAFVFVRDPESVAVADTALEQLFGFTPTESLVARALASGQSVEGIATEQGVSENTVRTHVRRLLVKTNTTRQGELISLLLRSTGVLLPPD